jgi:AraC-like DNA-binding protein
LPTSPRYATWSIVAIALEAGFGDLSHFNRPFKQRYLTTPSDLRAHPRDDEHRFATNRPVCSLDPGRLLIGPFTYCRGRA